MFFLFSFLSSKFYTSLVPLISATKHSNELTTYPLITTIIPFSSFFFLFFCCYHGVQETRTSSLFLLLNTAVFFAFKRQRFVRYIIHVRGDKFHVDIFIKIFLQVWITNVLATSLLPNPVYRYTGMINWRN